MKKFNLKLITPLILVLLLQGCMPDSLTKFKKDPPKKTVVASTGTPQVTDSAGNAVPLTPPTTFYYHNASTNTFNAVLDQALTTELNPVIDGSLGDPTLRASFLKNCYLDLTGNAQTQLLPQGLSLSSSTCQITGTPLAITTVRNPFCSDPAITVQATCTNAGKKWYKEGAAIPYKIVINYQNEFFQPKTISTTLNLGVYELPTLLGYSQHDLLVFGLDNTASLGTNVETSNYATSGLLTSSTGITGVVKFVDSTNKLAGVVRVTPLTLASVSGFIVNDFVYSETGAIGKIQKISGNTIYVERITSFSSHKFSKFESVKPGAKAVYPQAYSEIAAWPTTITSIDSSYVFDANTPGLDNNDQFYSLRYTQATITRVYEINTPIDAIIPIATSQTDGNGIIYSITPTLPVGLSLNASTGAITGTFTSALASTKFTITATNPLGSISFSMFLSAIEAPKDLSYTTKQLISVFDNSSFYDGESLFQTPTSPLLPVVGQVLRKYGTTQMTVNTINGAFLEGASIDSGNAYYSYKASVLANPISYSVALIVGDTTTIAVGDYVTSQNSAFGRVVAKDETSSTLFIQYLNSKAPLRLFQEKHSICVGYSCGETNSNKILQVESDNMKLTLSSGATAVQSGDDITATSAILPAVGGLSGYIHKKDGDDIYVSDIGRTQPYFFRIDQVIDNKDTVKVEQGHITAVAHDNFFVLEKDVYFEIKSNLSKGSGILYSISPALPPGMTLSASTGIISGTPTFATQRKTYTLSAKNLLNESRFIFELETREFFQVAISPGGAPSFTMHKYGDSRGARKCRINSADIKNAVANAGSVHDEVIDVRCFLDAEEQDLYTKALKFVVSPGVCENVQLYPYSFWAYPPTQTAPTSDVFTPTADCVTADLPAVPTRPTKESICDGVGHYGDLNCNATVVTVNDYAVEKIAGTCVNRLTGTSTLNCGGKIANCLEGPVREVDDFDTGKRFITYDPALEDPTKKTKTISFKAPGTLAVQARRGDIRYKSNMRVANGSVKNRCFSSKTDADALDSALFGLAATNNPFAGEANPFYTFECKDAANDTKARIRIVVRDWNKSFKLKDNIAADTIAAATTLMNNSDVDIFGKNNNDYKDWDDAYNGTAASGGGANCSVPSTWVENYKFPGDEL